MTAVMLACRIAAQLATRLTYMAGLRWLRTRSERLVGPVTMARRPQARDWQLRGWLTRADVLRALATELRSSGEEIEEGVLAAEIGVKNPCAAVHLPSTPLRGYHILELPVLADSPARGHRGPDIQCPPGCIVAAVTNGREIRAARPELLLEPGERVIVLAPAGQKNPWILRPGACPPAQAELAKRHFPGFSELALRGSDNLVWHRNKPAKGLEWMAIAVDLEFDGGTLEQYDEVARLMEYEPGGAAPEGCLFHWGALTDRGLRVTDVWETREQFEEYAREKIGPLSEQAGIPGPPRITFYDVHNYQAASG